jgi:hypothetical protein
MWAATYRTGFRQPRTDRPLFIYCRRLYIELGNDHGDPPSLGTWVSAGNRNPLIVGRVRIHSAILRILIEI